MPILDVIDGEGRATSIRFLAGATVKALLEGAHARIRSGCRGNGTCGLCRIWIEGDAEPATKAELLFLTGEQIAAGMRLACQTLVVADARIRVENPAPETRWRDLPPGEPLFAPVGRGIVAGEERPAGTLGMAIDLGTTNLSISLWDLAANARLAGCSGPNPQLRFGDDVMSRLVAASESEAVARELKTLVLHAIGDAVMYLCSRNGLNPWKISAVTIVGNTAELALLSSNNHHLLLEPSSWTSFIDCDPTDAADWPDLWNIDHGARISIVPPLAGFVGSDLLAGVLVTRMLDASEISLLVDIGTNTEFALWDGSRLWATAAAGGPAFEGMGYSCGTPAEPGAVYRVERNGQAGGYSLRVLPGTATDGAAPKGLCGTGFVDAIALLVEDGIVDSRGRFIDPKARDAYALGDGAGALAITSGDIDVFQRAKGAIGTGITVLLRMAGIGSGSLKKVYLCGSFGRFLDVERAQAVGMLPYLDPSAIELRGNTALAGCESLLTSPDLTEALDSIRAGTRLVNLSFDPDFAGTFMENLFLKPLGNG